MLPLLFVIPGVIAAIAGIEQNHPRTKIQNAIDDVNSNRITPQEANQKINDAHTDYVNMIVASQPDDQPRSQKLKSTISKRDYMINLYNSGKLTDVQMQWFKDNNHKFK